LDIRSTVVAIGARRAAKAVFNASPLVLCSLACLTLLVAGCAPFSKQRRTSAKYETVRAEPNRNADKARHFNDKAIGHIQSCEWERAIHFLQKALAADLTYGPAHNNLGRAYFAQGKYYLAAWELQHAITEMPGHAEPINNLGLVYETVGRNMEALEQYELAYSLEPTRAEYIGNLTRIRLVIDDKDPTVVELLRELVFYDTRPTWTWWAREQLALREQFDKSEIEMPREEDLLYPGEGRYENGMGLPQESERLPAPSPQWIDDQLLPPDNQPSLEQETRLQRSPVAQVAMWRFPPSNNQIHTASQIPTEPEPIAKPPAN